MIVLFFISHPFAAYKFSRFILGRKCFEKNSKDFIRSTPSAVFEILISGTGSPAIALNGERAEIFVDNESCGSAGAKMLFEL